MAQIDGPRVHHAHDQQGQRLQSAPAQIELLRKRFHEGIADRVLHRTGLSAKKEPSQYAFEHDLSNSVV
jgi:hypothetical protein